MPRHRQQGRNADPASDEGIPCGRGNQFEVVARINDGQHVPGLHVIAHAARAAAAVGLPLHSDDVAVPLGRVIAERIFALLPGRRAHAYVGAARELRQLRAREVAKLKQMHVLGDFLCAFDAEFPHGPSSGWAGLRAGVPRMFRRLKIFRQAPDHAPSTRERARQTGCAALNA